jgi:hypothetical protein
MGELTFSFETKRLRVFEAKVTPWPEQQARLIYVAFLQSGGAAQTVAHAVVADRRHDPDFPFPLYCELIERSSLFCGERYGQELFLEIEKHLGDTLEADATTEDGKRFLKSLGRVIGSLKEKARLTLTVASELARRTGNEQKADELLRLAEVAKSNCTSGEFLERMEQAVARLGHSADK